ncbi:alkaline phosphatase [Clostridium sp. DJ247]|uniref:alkaline phosphatase n=1 Tax=Clostridium sp. DJ247 TaxID=2726188 RepID=UPI0016248313|nr:alkaline phosphatase [Clostridium sp. DJ247]MBC2579050.1 alkaline phosphatase [Clostridium sp. DJ247]
MLKKKKWFLGVLSLVMTTSLLLSGCGSSVATNSSANPNTFTGKKNPKYVFLFIGDGMGISQINSAEIFLGNQKDPKNPNIQKLAFTQFPAQGMNTTYAADTFITDSASAGTAIATGHKTNDGVINMDPAKKEKYTSMAEMAKKKGMKVGIVSSVSLDHATPAVFYAHNPSRNNYYDISLELGKSNFDYFAGGGLKQPTGKTKDKPDAFKEAEKNGYKIVKDKASLEKLDSKSGKVIAISPKLDADQALPYAINNDKDSISLEDFTKKGINVLDNDKGFFMMVEGGKVDWACHANDAASSIHETLAFDKSIKQAVDFYEKHPDETLIVVTGDHETGGFTLGFAGTGYNTFFEKIGKQTISYDEFTKKVEAYKKAGHTADNAKLEDLLPLVKESYGLEAMDPAKYNELSKIASDEKNPKAKEAEEQIGMALSPKDMDDLRAALKQSMTEKANRAKDEQAQLLYGTYDPFTVTLTHILDHKAGLSFTSYSHTAVPIPVYVKGIGQDLFNGYYDNTDLFKKLTSIMAIS